MKHEKESWRHRTAPGNRAGTDFLCQPAQRGLPGGQAFLKTNRNSLQFSVFLSGTLVVAAILDFLILLVLTMNDAPDLTSVSSASVEAVRKYAFVALSMGFGESVPLMLVAPIVLLFSYTRIPKNKNISLLIPIAAIVLMVLIMLEGMRLGLGLYADTMKKMSLQQLIELISASMGK